MRFFRFFQYVFVGIGLGLLEWTLFNIAPVFGMVRLVLMVSLVLLVRGHLGAAFVVGCSGMFVRDVGSFSFEIPVYMILFVVLLGLFSLFARRIVTYHSMIGFGLFGLFGFAIFRLMTDIGSWMATGSAYSFRYFFWTEIFVSFIIYIVSVAVLQRKWRVLRVD